MGYAYGQLFGQEIANNANNIAAYGKSKISDVLQKFGLPTFWTDIIWTNLSPVFLQLTDMNWQMAEPFTPKRFKDELQGIADGSNGLVSLQTIIRVNLLGEITQAACTVLGSYGSATADGKLYHLRALDWEPTAPVNQYPSVVIYEPTEEGSNTFANIGYIGLIGTLTAVSKNGISIGEKVFYALSGDYNPMPHITYYGKPWMYVLRDVV